MKSQKSSANDWHQKIAKNRGEKWRKNMLKGRRDAQINPSNIRILRLTKGEYDQAELAKLIGLSSSTYNAIERGKQPVSEKVAKQIADKLKIQVSKIFKPLKKGKLVAIVNRTSI